MPKGVYFHKSHSEATKKKMSQSHVGSKHWNWKGGKRTALGYVMVKDAPKKYRQEHRIVAEKMLGRKLRKNECVHHKNHNKSDNRPINLEVMTKSEHHRHHAKEYWNRRHLIEKGIVKP